MINVSKKISYSIIFFINFLSGIEYAVILPTALQYLENFNGNQADLGFCLSAYSFSSLFSSPIFGKWSDISKNTKNILLFANLFQIAGSFMYFMGISKIFIIFGRLVAGIGLGVLGCIFSDVVKFTSIENRSAILSRIMMGRQIGMVIGPAFNFFFLKIDTKIGPFVLNKLSAPGFVMTSFWILLEIIVLFFYKNLYEFDKEHPPLSLNQSKDINENTPIVINNDESSTNQNKNYGSINSNDQNEFCDEEEKSLLKTQNDSSNIETYNEEILNSKKSNSTDESSKSIKIIDNSETGSFFIRFYEEYIREEVVTVYAASFTVFFMQTALETLVTPFTKDYFNFSDISNSILYGLLGVEIMVVFGLLSIFSKKISDRVLLVIGLIGNLVSLIFLIVYIPLATPFHNQNIYFADYALFIMPCILNVFSLPLIVLTSISLLSKVTSMKSQGLTQGLRRSFVGIGSILGPIWTGAFYKQWYILIGSLIGLLTISLIMTTLSFKYLTETKSEKNQTKQENNESIIA